MRTVFSRYRPIKPAVGAAVVGGVVLFAYARRSAGDVDGYVRLYQLGLALPSRLVAPDSGLRLSDFAVVSGSAWLAWLGGDGDDWRGGVRRRRVYAQRPCDE